MPQVQGIKAAAVVIYRKALITPEMGYHRLSRWVNNTVKKGSLLDITGGRILVIGNKLSQSFDLSGFTQISPCCLCNYEVVWGECRSWPLVNGNHSFLIT